MQIFLVNPSVLPSELNRAHLRIFPHGPLVQCHRSKQTATSRAENLHNPQYLWVPLLVVRIARPASLAIWHRRRSHSRPNRSGSPNRRHFASLDLKKHADVSHRRPTSQNFRRRFFWHFRVISDQANVFSHRWAKKSCSHR